MTIGQWVGQWFGEWFGSGEPAPAGSMSGTATVSLSTAGSASGTGSLEGAAGVILHSSGDLTVAASGAMSGVATIGVGATGALSSTSTPVTTSDYPFFSKGFWSAGFWSEGFWGDAGSAVVHPPYVETEYVVSCAARLAVRTSVDAVRLRTKVDGVSVLGRVQRIDLFERPKLEARRESKLRSKKAVLQQAASVLIVPRTENVATRALHTVVTTLPDDYVTWNELECMRVLDRKHVVTVKQGAEG